MLTLSWLCDSVDRENALAGIVSFSASAVHADTEICTPLNPWLIGARLGGAPDKFCGKP